MTTFEKRSAGTTYDDRDSHHERDSRREQDSRREGDNHQQRAGLPENVMSTWTVALYDYAEQVLQAQRQFAHSMLAAAAPMLNVTRDITRYNDDDTAEYNKRFADNNTSEDNTSDTSRTERSNTQAAESAKTRAPVTASATNRKRP